MSDEYFKSLDVKLGQQKTASDDKEKKIESNVNFNKKVMPRLKTIAEEYADKLHARKITATVNSSEHSISIELRYKNGGGRTLTLSPRRESERLEFVEYVRGDGKPYSATSGETYGEDNWNDELLRRRLQRFIDDHVFYADRSGGLG